MKSALLSILFFFIGHSLIAGVIISNGLSHEYAVQNGEIIKGSINLENSDDHPQDVKIYLQDLRYNAKGQTFYRDPIDSDQRSNANWIKLESNLLTLKPKEKRTIFYEISVPQSGINPGSYWSVIMVEPTKTIETKESKSGISIRSIVRYAIQIVTNNQTESLKPNLKFERVKLDTTDGIRRLQVALANVGNLYVKPTASIEFYDPQTGEKIGRYSSIPMVLLPDNDKMFTIDISKVKPGKYSAVLLATDDADNAFAKNIVLEIKND